MRLLVAGLKLMEEILSELTWECGDDGPSA